MFRYIYQLIALVTLSSLTSAAQDSTQVRTIDPFQHVVRVPAGIDLSTIRFERAKIVKTPTQVYARNNDAWCQALEFRDPGGSMYCPSIQFGGSASAYEVTYSYQGQPMSSDEYGGRYFTFSVYFRPDEFSLQTRETLARGRAARSDIAAIFNMTASQDRERRAVIDEESSTFCEGTYMDGVWKQLNPDCKDKIKSKIVDVLPEYVTIRIASAGQLAAKPRGSSDVARSAR